VTVETAPLDAVPGVRVARPAVAVLVPCLNEARSIGRVVHDFQAALPAATIFVYDNNSTDATVEVAAAAGAEVRRETRQGKGHVVRRMFADVDADIYVIVDGDGTYEAASAPAMISRMMVDQLDMVVGRRDATQAEGEAYRRGHATGNQVFSRILRMFFGGTFTDVFSGYRVMSRRLVKSFPVTSSGFEIETEITAHAVAVEAASAEVDTPYRARHEDSPSKLRTYRDGVRILTTAVRLFKNLRPMRFFSIIAGVLTVVAIALGLPILIEFFRTGLVPRLPTAVLAAAIEIVAFVALSAGLVLEGIHSVRREVRRLAYLAEPPPWAPPRG